MLSGELATCLRRGCGKAGPRLWRGLLSWWCGADTVERNKVKATMKRTLQRWTWVGCLLLIVAGAWPAADELELAKKRRKLYLQNL